MPVAGTRWERYPLPTYAWCEKFWSNVFVESVQPAPSRPPGQGLPEAALAAADGSTAAAASVAMGTTPPRTRVANTRRKVPCLAATDRILTSPLCRPPVPDPNDHHLPRLLRCRH